MHKEEDRTPAEVTTDKILLLSLFSLSAEKGKSESMLKAQKLSFIAAAPLFCEREKVFSLEFYRYKWGAMSTGVYQAIDDFHELGFMERKEHLLSDPTDRAKGLVREFVKDVLEGIPENQFVYDQLQNVSEQLGPLKASQLVSIVYNMQICTIESNDKRTVRDTPLSHHFTLALDDGESKKKLVIPDDWMDTLSIALSPANHATLVAAMKSPTVYAQF